MMNRAMIVALATVFFCAPVMAGLGGYVGWTDPGSGFTWKGVTELKTENPAVPGTYLQANVEWVVAWDSGASSFHYIYQLSALGDYEISRLAIPMLASNEAIGIGSFATAAGEVAPLTANFLPAPPAEATNAVWTFSGLNPGSVSYALNYWSVNVPQTVGGYIQDGGFYAATADLPSPNNLIPEPATVILVALGALAGFKRRRMGR